MPVAEFETEHKPGDQTKSAARGQPKHLRRFLNEVLGIDGTVFMTLLARTWSSLAGAVTIFVIARCLSPAEQGYYYTLSSLVALQFVFELGFSFVILQLASHERAFLVIEGCLVDGNPRAHSRLASILQKCMRYYGVMAVAMGVLVLPAGIYFFEASQPGKGEWLMPWSTVVLAACINLALTPLYSFLEGCGMVAAIAKMRFGQCVFSAISSWLCLASHHGLFAPAAALLAQALWGGVWIIRRRELLIALWTHEPGEDLVCWKTEIWPFQWRIALSWLSGYFIFQLFNPMTFAFQGPVVAGQMGMSLSVATAVGNAALAWITTKAAPFGVLIAKQDFKQLDKLFDRALKQSLVLLCVVCVAIWTGDVMLGHFSQTVQRRFLPPAAFGFLLATTVLTHVMFSQAVYLRAHKRESFLSISVISAVMVTGSTLFLSKYSNALAVMVSYFLVHGVFCAISGTMIFTRSRRAWHADVPRPALSRRG